VREPKRSWLWLVFLPAVGYLVVAEAVFSFRHPWMTETERFIYLPRALTFGHVSYDDARPR
jgi:hypothetical protein